MSAVRLAAINVADERYAREHIARAIAEILAAIDDGERDGCGVPEKHEHRHRHKAVQSAGDAGQFRACGRFAGWPGLQIHGKKDVGFDFLGVEGAGLLQQQTLPAIPGEF